MLLIASQDPKARPIICVFDGLDEATEESRTSLVGKLCEVYNNNNNGKWQPHPKLKVLVTSRPYESLRRDFEGLGSQLPIIHLRGERENKTIHWEIDIVIAHKVQDVAKQLNMSNSSRERLERALLSMENRTYLWLYLAIEDFRQTYVDLLDPESQDFDTLPHSVEEAYEKILARTSKKAWIHARRTFSIILGAQRPLRTGELRLALLMLQEDSGSLSRIKVRITKAKLETLVRQWCGLFVFFQDGKIHLIHQTAKDFLLRPEHEEPPTSGTWRHSISMKEANCTMVDVCTQLLGLTDFDTPDSPIWAALQHETKYLDLVDEDFRTLLQYVIRNGSMHLKAGSSSSPVTWLGVESDIDHQGLQYINYRFPTRVAGLREDLCGLIMFHLPMVMALYDDILERRFRMADLVPEEESHARRNALLVATELGLYRAVEWLIDKGTDIEVHNGSDNALCIAAACGYSEIIKLLLERGARLDILGASALYQAVFAGHETSVALLVDAGVDIDTSSVRGASALITAVQRGNPQLVKLLLEKGASPKMRKSCIATSFGLALLYGEKDIISILMDYDVDFTAKDEYHNCTPLENAFASLDVSVVRLLSKNVAALGDMDSKNKALLSTCYGRDVELIRLALSLGADVNTVGPYGCPIHLACRSMIFDINKPPSVAGANVNASNPAGYPLQPARRPSILDIVTLLVNAGADVNAFSPVGYPLQSACRHADLPVVEHLMQKGANVNIARGKQGTILEEVVVRADEDMVKTIIAYGADLSLYGKYGGILHATLLKSSNPGLIALLLRSGADVNAEAWFDLCDNQPGELWDPGFGEREQFYGPALLVALHRGMIQSASILRKAGACENLSGPLGNVNSAVDFLHRLTQLSREQKLELKDEYCAQARKASGSSRPGSSSSSNPTNNMVAADWSRWRIISEFSMFESDDSRPEPEHEHDATGGGQVHRVVDSHPNPNKERTVETGDEIASRIAEMYRASRSRDDD